MPIEKKLEKVKDEFDPRRCQGNIKTGQCPFIAKPGQQYCHLHSGGVKIKEAKERIRNYHLTKWQGRINEFADSTEIKSLREEIGISRMILENILDQCQDSTDLLLYSNKIADHVLKIEKVVSSCHRLEAATGTLLDKTTVLQVANTMVEIISDYITDSDILTDISNRLIETITESTKPDYEQTEPTIKTDYQNE